MALYYIYFSPTGGTKRVADCLCNTWRCNIKEINLAEPHKDFSQYAFHEEDVCMVAVPAFGGRVPTVAAERIAHMIGGNASAVLVCVYGNRAYEDTLLELKDLLAVQGFRCVAAVAAVAEHSIVHQFAAGRPNEQDESTLASFGRKIQAKLTNENLAGDWSVDVPGNRPYREYKNTPLASVIGMDCTHCGLCAEKCPTQSISPENIDKIDPDTCISCMQCVAICPQHTRQMRDCVVTLIEQKIKKVCEVPKKNELFL